MRASRAFWDTSALIPLVVRQAGSQRARQLLRKYPATVVAWVTLIEFRGTVARLVRAGELPEAARRAMIVRLDQMRRTWVEVLPTSSLRETAIDCLDRYDLRAADAVQLASAIEWCDGRPSRRPFITFDDRLAAAATLVGFEVLQAR
ncbi:MAG TPA: type II toxin-antitoxin system VapC family toxin [Blastocatellia bacterium]|nr:type II toxin-antitoxin system VapC family toxin [Blastocatellia bacterium]